jgi:biotin carboxyl carrier protein
MKYLTTINGKTYTIDINQDGRVTIDGEDYDVNFTTISEALYSVILNHTSFEALVDQRDGRFNVLVAGEQYEVEVADEQQQRLLRTSGGFEVSQGELSIRSPMPGLIVAVKVTEGQIIEKGDALCVLESMKMENDIKAPRAGTVSRVYIAAGDRVEQNKVLLMIT